MRGRRGSSLTSTSRQAFLLECGSAEEQEKWKGALEKEAAAGRNRMGRGSIATLTSMGGRLPSVSEGAPPDSPASEGASLAGEDEEEEDEEEEDERSEAGEAKEAVEEEEEEDESGSEYETDDDESGSEYETETDEDDEEAAKVAAMPLPVSPGGSVGHKSGWVWKESDHLRNWRRRWLSCKDGMLTYTKTQPKGLGAVDVPQISLKHAHVGPPKTARARPYCFRVTLAVEGAGGSGEDGDGKAAVAEGGAAGVKYVLAADTASEKMEWLAALRENIAIAGGAAPRARCALHQPLSAPVLRRQIGISCALARFSDVCCVIAAGSRARDLLRAEPEPEPGLRAAARVVARAVARRRLRLSRGVRCTSAWAAGMRSRWRRARRRRRARNASATSSWRRASELYTG